MREMGWRVVEWVRQTRPLILTLENVQEYTDWGPLDERGYPIEIRKGETWEAFLQALRDLGMSVEYRLMNAADYGAATIRTRLFLVARRDGQATPWPAASHGPKCQQPFEAAGNHIDWSIPAPSIFERDKPLVEATINRILKGIDRFILNDPQPFLAPPQAQVSGKDRSGKVAAFLAQNNGGMIGRSLREPSSTIVGTASTQALVSAQLSYLDKARNNAVGIPLRDPAHTLCTGDHFAEVRVEAFCAGYYSEGGGQMQDLRRPMGTITTRDRFAVVMVEGTEMVITDIGYRFLTPRELFSIQGFPKDYRLDLTANGRPIGSTHLKRMVGNSVSPPPGRALAAAILQSLQQEPALALAA